MENSNLHSAAILFVDDEKSILETLRRLFRKSNYQCHFAQSGNEALEILENNVIDIVVSDMKMPEMTGDQLLKEVSERFPETIRIVLSAFAEDDIVMNAINQGRIWGFIHKPWNNHELLQTIEHAVFTQQVVAERSLLKQTLNQYQSYQKDSFQGFIGSSIPMQFVYSSIEKAAPSNASVFIMGESGTGKEVTAKALHDLSKRSEKPFIALNCAAIPSELMESEIFGHVKGAFSGAISNRDGAATLADGGTLFLDELSEMDISLQSKLLRFIQTGTFQKVGSSQQEQVDIRFISATNRDPLQAIEEKKLREDLYYRLNVISVNLPALKERDNDPYLLATQFLKHFSNKEEKTMAGFSSGAEKLILGYTWPGNVRQLENVVHSAVIMSDGPLVTDKDIAQALGTPLESLLAKIRTPADKQSPSALSTASTSSSNSASTAELSPAEPSDAFSGLSEGIKPAVEQLPDDTTEEIVPLAKVEEVAIKNAIEQCDGNVVKAASLLEVSPSTLYRKIQSW